MQDKIKCCLGCMYYAHILIVNFTSVGVYLETSSFVWLFADGMLLRPRSLLSCSSRFGWLLLNLLLYAQHYS